MRPDAPCFDNPDPFGAGAQVGDPTEAVPLCAKCPVDKNTCLDRFVRLHDKTHGVAYDMTVAGLAGLDLRKAIARRLNRKRAA